MFEQSINSKCVHSDKWLIKTFITTPMVKYEQRKKIDKEDIKGECGNRRSDMQVFYMLKILL